VQEQLDVGAKTELAATYGGKGSANALWSVLFAQMTTSNQCPLLRGPKPSVAYCAALDDNGGFFHIQATNEHDIVAADVSPATALIKVESGEVSDQLLLITWRWEAHDEGHKCFIVPFPSKEELTRMVAVGTITTKNKEGTFSIEEFVDDVHPIKVLDQVWVTFTKVPQALRSFLPLWAVGTMIGATQKVDIQHLRRTGKVRILVVVLDIKKYQNSLMFV
jgi:hypothetical protein